MCQVLRPIAQQAANCSPFSASRSVLYPRKLAIRKLTRLALYRFVYTRLERWRAKVVFGWRGTLKEQEASRPRNKLPRYKLRIVIPCIVYVSSMMKFESLWLGNITREDCKRISFMLCHRRSREEVQVLETFNFGVLEIYLVSKSKSSQSFIVNY